MNNAMNVLALCCASIMSVACASTHPNLVDTRTENNAGIAMDKPASKPNLSGTWTLNKELSDNPQEKIKESRQQAGNSKGNKGKGGGSGGGGRGGKGGGGKRGGAENRSQANKGHGRRQARLPQELWTLLKASETMKLRHEEPLITIMTKDGQRQRIYTDFRGASISASGGMQQQVTTAGWENDILVVETTMDSGSIIQRYKLNISSRQLFVSSLILTSSLPKPVQFNRFYEVFEAKTEANRTEQNVP